MNVDVIKGLCYGLIILIGIMFWIRINLDTMRHIDRLNRKSVGEDIMNIYNEILPKLPFSIRGEIFKYVYVNEVLRVDKVYKDENGVIFRVSDIQEVSEGKLIKYGVEILWENIMLSSK